MTGMRPASCSASRRDGPCPRAQALDPDSGRARDRGARRDRARVSTLIVCAIYFREDATLPRPGAHLPVQADLSLTCRRTVEVDRRAVPGVCQQGRRPERPAEGSRRSGHPAGPRCPGRVDRRDGDQGPSQRVAAPVEAAAAECAAARAARPGTRVRAPGRHARGSQPRPASRHPRRTIPRFRVRGALAGARCRAIDSGAGRRRRAPRS